MQKVVCETLIHRQAQRPRPSTPSPHHNQPFAPRPPRCLSCASCELPVVRTASVARLYPLYGSSPSQPVINSLLDFARNGQVRKTEIALPPPLPRWQLRSLVYFFPSPCDALGGVGDCRRGGHRTRIAGRVASRYLSVHKGERAEGGYLRPFFRF